MSPNENQYNLTVCQFCCEKKYCVCSIVQKDLKNMKWDLAFPFIYLFLNNNNMIVGEERFELKI